MTQAVRLTCLLLMALLAFIRLANASEFAALVRDLNTMQNRMVMGDEKANAAATFQLQLIEESFASFDLEIWKDEKNIRAAAVYLLCGGAPAKLRKVYDEKRFPEDAAPLLLASLNYAEGHRRSAAKLLMDFDPRRYPSVLGGHLALAQGGSMIGADNARAISLLDLARLLMPASLVEEAALRREVAIVDPLRNNDKLYLLGNRYVTKYLASPYAANFWYEFSTTLRVVSSRLDMPTMAKFEALLDKAPSADRAQTYLAMARQALLAGKIAAAAGSIAKAESITDMPTTRNRVLAYRAAISALTGESTASLAALRQVDRSGLPRGDVEMIGIVESAISRLDESVDAMETRWSQREATIDASGKANAETPAVVLAARQALEQTEALLRRVTKP